MSVDWAKAIEAQEKKYRASFSLYGNETTIDHDPRGDLLVTQGCSHGKGVVWTVFGGYRNAVHVRGCETPEQATEEAFALAKEQGWTPPRWWQWWRWEDTRPPEAPQAGA